MRDDDATLRDEAARALRSFVKAAASMDHVRDICRDDLVPHVLDALALADDSRPVSYTHLTLPTILRV